VLTGWDGSDGMLNPTDLFYQIVDRYSDTIANIFYGHTHEDFFNVSDICLMSVLLLHIIMCFISSSTPTTERTKRWTMLRMLLGSAHRSHL
jgi:hypothetical protein